MTVTWKGLPEQWQSGVSQIVEFCGDLDESVTVTVVDGGSGVNLSREGDTGTLRYGSVHDLMRGVTLWLGHAKEATSFTVDETARFKEVGAMMDLARNGVLTVDYLKHTILRLASLGYTEAWLYLEDVFEIPEEPYFGLQRGRYSQADLHELAVYADQFGLTLVPAIQTLAHLQNALKWEAFQDIKDTPEVLYVEHPATTKFLEHMLKAASAPFTTNKIHIGMDEAYGLGMGDRAIKEGFVDQQTLIQAHLKTVYGLTQKLGLNAYMWSDMWFTIASPTHTMYDETVHFTKEFVDQMPNVGQVYWDYYHEDVETYVTRLKQHFELKQPVVWAGGIWTWNGIAPQQDKMLASIKAGMTGSAQVGVEEVVGTMWMDDGAETPFEASWLGLQTFIEYAYHEEVSEADLARQFKLMQGESAEAFLLLNEFDRLPGNPLNFSSENPSKIVLYEDLLLQRYQVNLAPYDLYAHYMALAEKLLNVTTTEKTELLFKFYHCLADTLASKGQALRQLQAVKQQPARDVSAAKAALELYSQHLALLAPLWRAVWHRERRGNGYEVIDVRLGGQQARVQTVLWRLNQYHEGLDDLAELDEVKLPMDKKTSGPIGHGLYKEVVSACDLSH